jgi:hypothetical protein
VRAAVRHWHGWRRPSKEAVPPPSVVRGPSESVKLCGDRATATFEDICNRAIAAKILCRSVHKGGGDGTVYYRTMSFDPIVETFSLLHVWSGRFAHSLGEEIMSSGASIYSYGCKPPITTENLHGTSCEGSGTIANAAPSQLQSEPQLAMDRLLRECLARKSPRELKARR